MIPGGNLDLASVRRDNSNTQFCPECGQPLVFARAEPDQRHGASWRSLFVIVVGLLFSITFGLGTMHAAGANQTLTACPGSWVEAGCAPAPQGMTTRLSSPYLTGGDVLAPRLTDRDLGSDLRFLVLGLGGLCVGLGAALVHLKRPRRFGFGVNLLLAVEGVLTVFYGEILVLGVYLLIGDPPIGAPITFGSLGDSLFRALSMVFALVGVQ